MSWRGCREWAGCRAAIGAVAAISIFAVTPAGSRGTEPDAPHPPVEPGILDDAWVSMARGGAGVPLSTGRLGSPFSLSGESGDPYSVLVLFDGVPLYPLRTGWVDWTGFSLGSARATGFTPGGWSSRNAAGALDGQAGLAPKRTLLDTPVSRVALLQGPRGHRRKGAEFGRTLAGKWGTYWSIENVEGTPTESSIRHDLAHLGVVLEGKLGNWHTRATVRRYDGEREWGGSEVPPDGMRSTERTKEAILHAQGEGLGAQSVVVCLWSRDLSAAEERRSGLDLARTRDRAWGGRVDLSWKVGKRHRWGLELDAERLSHEWLYAPDGREWRAGVWLGDEVDGWGGTVRVGVRGEYHEGYGRQPMGEAGWTRPAGGGRVDVSVFRTCRAPAEYERRYSENPPEASTRSGGRLEYRRGEPGRDSGIRVFAWEEEHRPVWGTAAWDEGPTSVRWMLLEDRIRAVGSVLWFRRDSADRGGIWSSLVVRRVRGSGGDPVPLAPAAGLTLGGDLRLPLPLSETSLVASFRGYGWSDTDLPEGGSQAAGMVLDLEAGFELSTFQVRGGIRNVLGTEVAESPFLPLRERWTGEASRFGTVTRYACQTERETYFGMSLVLYD